MTDTIHALIGQYGLIAVFLGCLAEGETAAILAGFFAHQGVFMIWQASAAVFLGAFLGDMAFFLFGRRFSETPFVGRLRRKPGFDRALDLMRRHPALYVIGNRYVYGFRLAGGVAAGLSGIPAPLFIVLNAMSAAVWTTLFVGIGYVFGIGAERIIGEALLAHQRLLVALALGVVFVTTAFLLARHAKRKADDA